MRQVQPETLPKNSNLPVYKISSLKITPPKTPNSGQFSYQLPNIVSFLLEKKIRLEFRFRSRDFSFILFPVWRPYCWGFWSAIVPMHTSTINAPLGSVLTRIDPPPHNVENCVLKTKVYLILLKAEYIHDHLYIVNR